MRFHDQVIWITGASSGIGEALAHAFDAEGARLILSARREDHLFRVRDQCSRSPESVAILPMDMMDLDTMPATVSRALALCGHIDILVHNAGIGQRDRAVETDIAVDRWIMETNFLGPVALTKAVLPSMLARKQGHLVVISSVVGKIGVPGRTSYSASKHALQGFFDALRAEVWRQNIAVTLICPGYVHTDFSRHAMQGDGTPSGIMDPRIANGISAEACAAAILKAVCRKKEEAYIGGWETYGIYLKAWIPSLVSRILRYYEAQNAQGQDDSGRRKG